MSMNKKEKLLIKWRNNILLAAKALEENNYSAYEDIISSSNNIVNKMKQIDDLTYECKTFGQSNYIFEDVLPSLFKKNKNIVKEFITLIKEDKNLLSQFQFLSALKNYKNSISAEQYVKESLELVQKNIDIKTLNESNQKLADLIHKYEICPSKPIDEETNHFFESCDYVIKSKKKLNNLYQTNENLNYIQQYIQKNAKANIQEARDNVSDKILSFDLKYKNLLNINEKKLLKNILSNDETQSKATFNELKNECLKLTNELLTKSNDECEKEKIASIQETIQNMCYSTDTLVENITKFLNIREVLLA